MYMLLLGLHTEQTLLELYQASKYYQDTCLRIQPVVDKFRNSAQVKCVENGKKIDYQSSFWTQVCQIDFYAEYLRKYW